MIYLFEDKADDYLSALFRSSLPESIKSRISYACGNGNLLRLAENFLMTGETVVVVLDTIPANKSIRDIYIALRRLSRQNEYRLIVWNVICAEYYFIKAFGRERRLRAFEREVDYEIATEVLPYKASALIKTDEDSAFTKTFEKFCKLYMLKNGGRCIQSELLFFAGDCKCDTECKKEALGEKSDQYRKAYGIDTQSQVHEALWAVHRELLAISNKAIERYNQAGYLNIKPYPAIR